MSPYVSFLLRLEAFFTAQLARVKAALRQQLPMDKLYLITDYPTIADPGTTYALGLAVANTANQARTQTIELLKATGLEVGPGDLNAVAVSEIDTSVASVTLIFG